MTTAIGILEEELQRAETKRGEYKRTMGATSQLYLHEVKVLKRVLKRLREEL